jgi:hypothetical protein
MKKYIAYFDFLGYKEFILNNDSDYLSIRINHIVRDIKLALSKGKCKEPDGFIISPDISQTRINCLNVSDTVIFWTFDDSVESLEELLIIANEFNWRQIKYNFPVRGVIYFDKIEMYSEKSKNTVEATYSANLIYGQGLVKAHLKTESLDWAGSVIDKTVIDSINDKVGDIDIFLKPYAKLYKVPYKKNASPYMEEEYALRLNKSDNLTDQKFESFKQGIINVFKMDNKSIESPRVEEILTNTIKYLETYYTV